GRHLLANGELGSALGGFNIAKDARVLRGESRGPDAAEL
ncbi:MAG: hypothetical protein AVDCRST_MAG28-3731, partial [uncultured Rubrobacteraceae bacterium]